MTEPAPLLQVDGLKVRFGGLKAVDDVSFSVGTNEIVALIGPNGAGKTTTFNAILGAITPDAGRILLSGEDVTGEPPERMADRGVTRTFQNVRMFGDLTVRENLMVGSYPATKCGLVTAALRLPRHKRAEALARSRADSWLEKLGLQAYADAQAGVLPLGLQRVAEIGRAMVNDPPLVLLDEPASGLNEVEKQSLARLLKDIAGTTRSAILLIDHSMSLVMNVAHRIVVLDFGCKIAEGRPDDVARNPAVIEAYMGV